MTHPLLTIRVSFPMDQGGPIREFKHSAKEGVVEREAGGFLTVRHDDGSATTLVAAADVIVLDMPAYRARLEPVAAPLIDLYTANAMARTFATTLVSEILPSSTVLPASDRFKILVLAFADRLGAAMKVAR